VSRGDAAAAVSQEATTQAVLAPGPAGFAAVRLRLGGARLAVEEPREPPPDSLPIAIPGFVDAHSHAFQRLLRGRAESRAGDFWSWRERMYRIASRLEPDDVRVASRAAFLEMLLSGCTSVVEFHYLHHDRSGRPYAAANAAAEAVLDAAAEVGIRIRLLMTAYARGGPGRELDPTQRRFADPTPDAFVARVEELRASAAGRAPLASIGVALHSVRALPRPWLEELAAWAAGERLPVHAHVAEQVAEVEACVSEHGVRPVELLDGAGALGPRFTAVHAVHVTDAEIALLAGSGAAVCACPSTEANLGDGFVPAGRLLAAGVPLALGSDSHAAIDPFAEARELDYRERLRSGSRRGLAPAARLLEIASEGGARSAGWVEAAAGASGAVGAGSEGLAGPAAGGPAVEAGSDGGPGPATRGPAVGRLENGWAADVVILDEAHPALAGADPASLAETLLLAGSPALVREVWVGGERVVDGGRHPRQDAILEDFRALQRRIWSD
jgi:formimidoylglutamate deiminase